MVYCRANVAVLLQAAHSAWLGTLSQSPTVPACTGACSPIELSMESCSSSKPEQIPYCPETQNSESKMRPGKEMTLKDLIASELPAAEQG